MFEPPLVVDLDGTIIKTDLLYESASQAILCNPLNIFRLITQLFKGKAQLKEYLSSIVTIDPVVLPYNKSLLAWLSQQKVSGRTVIMATATHSVLAYKIADHLKIFDDVLATDSDINLSAVNKRDILVKRYGEHGFDYIGNDTPDFPVWSSSRCSYVVSSSPVFIKKVSNCDSFVCAFSAERLPLHLAILKVLRPHQWIKNLLIFVPLLAAHGLSDFKSFISAIIAFVVFSLTASGVYILNDLVDLADDRHHQSKRRRPFASGNLSILVGWVMWPALIFFAFLLGGFFLSLSFVGVLAIYFVLTLAYSLRFKQCAMLDVLTLATLYTIRIIAGASSISVPLSFWLLTFSVFIFLSLAFIKRFSELKSARNLGQEGNIRGRGYVHQDLELVSSMGSSAGYISVLVLALYIQDAHTAKHYLSPQLIWLACPILLYWISRAWLIAHRGQMHDDPIVFAIKDRMSWTIGTCILGVFMLAKFL